jgi:photosystem II stability/assembly factor-like uncharacterized protein
MKADRLWCSLALLLPLVWTAEHAQDSAVLVSHVSRAIPVSTARQVLSAERPISARAAATTTNLANSPANSWKLLATLPGTIIHDLIFVSTTTGYAAAEGGQVWKTSNGGKSWSMVLNLGYPYYFYGVAALSAKKVVVSGFIDSATQQSGIIRWTEDGGSTWGSDITLKSSAWLQRTRFANVSDGVIFDLADGAAQYTTDGGAAATDWITVTNNPDAGWFGLQFSLLTNRHVRASGINFCTSLNGGAAWTCGASVDSVFDGPVLFQGDSLGWVGGGEISPNVEGWIHITTNGGKTWSARVLDGPWPIRQFVFTSTKRGWAAGGNVYTGVCGIYFTSDGGNTWSVDVTTNAEMDACDEKPLKTGHQVWYAGYDASFNGVIYSTTAQ